MKTSIQKKINRLLSRSIIALSFIMIAFNLIIIYINSTKNAETIMSRSCSSVALELNNQFKLVEQSVKNLYDISEDFRPEYDELKNKEKADEYVDLFKNAAITIAENTDGALAIYYRMNPDIGHSGTTGFLYVKSKETGKFESNEVTDLYKYDVYDVEHVGWYYIPVWAGEAVWMEPYYNANIDVEMISYVVPIYDKCNLVGVVGIDVDFGEIKEIAENLDIYDSCGAVLCSMSDSAVYYNESNLFGNTLPNEIYSYMQGKERSENIFTYKKNKERYGLYFQTLDNQMKFLIYANEREIYSQGRYTILISIAVFAIVFAFTLILALKMGKKIVKPISDITEATKKYADGNWDIRVTCDTQDELQLLAENISIMADKTQNYIQCIKDMANKDVLTGLRNKTAYSLYVDMMKEKYIPVKKKFAVVVFDVNHLKDVNDHYGHEKGDELIASASKIICKAFAHSPVFRIGGDEFTAIVNGADYDNRDAIVAKFQQQMREAKESNDIRNVCVACGMAEYDEDGTNFEEVFALADQRMYANKSELKDGEKPR